MGSTDHLPRIHFQKTTTHICLSIYTSVKQGERRGKEKKEGGIKREEGKPPCFPALVKTLAIRTGYEHGLHAKNNGKC